MKFCLTLFLVFTFSYSFGQAQETSNLVYWNATKKLTEDDFGTKVNNPQAGQSFAQFSLDYEVHGFDFMTKNFNKKVHNYFIKSASWINTSANVAQNVRYQQTLFDLCEVYARQFRKALQENRLKIAHGTKIAQDLNHKAMTDFTSRRMQYELETNSGALEIKQKEWEATIEKELNGLKAYASE